MAGFRIQYLTLALLAVLAGTCETLKADEELQNKSSLAPVFPSYPETPLRGDIITIREGITTVQEKELPPNATAALPAATPEQLQSGEAILRRTAKFLDSQESIAFQALKHTDEEGTMGFVGGDQRITLQFAHPNQLAYCWKSLDQSNGFVEVISDGEFIIRREYGRCYVSAAPQKFTELVASTPLKKSSAWRFDAAQILRLFSAESLDDLLRSCEVSYRGTRNFGPVKTDRLILDGGGPTPNDWWSVRWELYIAQGDQPVPVYLRPDLDGLFPSLAGKDRWSASDVRFTDWSFGDSDPIAFRVEVGKGEELVDSRNALSVGEAEILNPMVGQPLPDFSGVDRAGQSITRDEIVGKKPLVLILWGSENAAIGPWWEKFDLVRKKYESRGIRFETLHIGDDSQLESGLATWNAAPPVLNLSTAPDVFAKGSSAIDWYGKRKPVAPGKTIQAYVVSPEGITQQIVERGPNLIEELSVQLDGLLNGREMASENAKSLQQKQADRMALIERINNRFSGKSDTAMSAIQSNKTRVSIAAELNRR
ncbi:MAG: hypothetical protein AAF483_23615, partial [Planctomycetota bacterium]